MVYSGLHNSLELQSWREMLLGKFPMVEQSTTPLGLSKLKVAP